MVGADTFAVQAAKAKHMVAEKGGGGATSRSPTHTTPSQKARLLRWTYLLTALR